MGQKNGLFIVFEGPEGAGKTTQSKLLAKKLEKSNRKVIYLREPGGTALGEKVRDILLAHDIEIPPKSELFLFLAARNVLVESVIKPALAGGNIAITDRFDLSTKAYQIYGRGLPKEGTIAANDFAKDGIEPDICFVFMVDPEMGFARKKIGGKAADRIESEGEDFRQRVLEGYKHFVTTSPNVFVIETANKTIEEIEAIVFSELKKRFPKYFS